MKPDQQDWQKLVVFQKIYSVIEKLDPRKYNYLLLNVEQFTKELTGKYS